MEHYMLKTDVRENDNLVRFIIKTKKDRITFYSLLWNMREFLNDRERRQYIEKACNSFIVIGKTGKDNMLYVRIYDLYESYGIVYGKQYDFYVNGIDFEALIDESGKILVDSERPNNRNIIFQCSKTLHNVVSSKKHRNAFRKFMRYAFIGYDTVFLYDDGKYDFYFEEVANNGKCLMNGGVIYDNYGKNQYCTHT